MRRKAGPNRSVSQLAIRSCGRRRLAIRNRGVAKIFASGATQALSLFSPSPYRQSDVFEGGHHAGEGDRRCVRSLQGFSLIRAPAVHPLVLLNATDHFTRTTAGDLNRRVVGILLGEVSHGKVDVTNSYAGERALRLARWALCCVSRLMEAGSSLGAICSRNLDFRWTVPFEEDAKDPTTWFLDHNYHEDMFAMFKKVNGECHRTPIARPSRVDACSACLQLAKRLLGGTARVRRFGPPIWVRSNFNALRAACTRADAADALCSDQ